MNHCISLGVPCREFHALSKFGIVDLIGIGPCPAQRLQFLPDTRIDCSVEAFFQPGEFCPVRSCQRFSDYRAFPIDP